MSQEKTGTTAAQKAFTVLAAASGHRAVRGNLKLGTGPREKWYFFTPATP